MEDVCQAQEDLLDQLQKHSGDVVLTDPTTLFIYLLLEAGYLGPRDVIAALASLRQEGKEISNGFYARYAQWIADQLKPKTPSTPEPAEARRAPEHCRKMPSGWWLRWAER